MVGEALTTVGTRRRGHRRGVLDAADRARDHRGRRSSTRATSRRTSSPTSTHSRPCSRTRWCCCTARRSARCRTSCRCWRRSPRAASRSSSSPRTSRARRCPRWWSTRSARRSRPSRSRRRSSVTAARRSSTTSPSSPAARSINPDVGIVLREAGLDVLGSARRVVVTKDETTIVDGAGTEEAIAARVAQLRGEIEHTDSDWDREKLEERLAKLSGGVAVIKVGAATETDAQGAQVPRRGRGQRGQGRRRGGHRRRRRLRAGAGAAKAWSQLRDSLSGDEAIGVDVVRTALTRAAVLDRHQRRARRCRRRQQGRRAPARHGFNAATLTYGDLLADGVIDPVKVTRSAVVNAASVARMMLTTESAVVEKPAERGRRPRPWSRPSRSLALGSHQDEAPPVLSGLGVRQHFYADGPYTPWGPGRGHGDWGRGGLVTRGSMHVSARPVQPGTSAGLCASNRSAVVQRAARV